MLSGESLPDWKTVLSILYELGAAPDVIARLKDLHKVADASTSSISFVPDLSAEYLRLRLDEIEAVRERTLNPTGLPGPLQTKGYAEFAARQARRRVPEGWPEVAGDERNERKALLTRDVNPLRLESVIAESALRVLDGLPRDDRNEQLDVLISTAEQGLADFFIRPFDRGPYGAYQLTLLSFPEDDEPDSAYLDTRLGLAIVDDADTVNVLRAEWCDARDEAMTPPESIAFLKKMKTG